MRHSRDSLQAVLAKSGQAVLVGLAVLDVEKAFSPEVAKKGEELVRLIRAGEGLQSLQQDIARQIVKRHSARLAQLANEGKWDPAKPVLPKEREVTKPPVAPVALIPAGPSLTRPGKAPKIPKMRAPGVAAEGTAPKIPKVRPVKPRRDPEERRREMLAALKDKPVAPCANPSWFRSEGANRAQLKELMLAVLNKGDAEAAATVAAYGLGPYTVGDKTVVLAHSSSKGYFPIEATTLCALKRLAKGEVVVL